MADTHTKEQRRKNMQRIKSKDTSIELLLRKELWRRGYRYRKNYSKLPGKPDIALTKYKIAIFCDSEFFHGKDWEVLKPRLERGDNADYWVTKIARNRNRDEEINKKLNRTVSMIHNCQNCGATLEIQENHPIFHCKYCNTTYVIGTLRTNSTY